jgi:hypothetical protein
MSRLLLATLFALPLSVSAAPPAEGRIESDGSRLEILGQPVRVGETIQLPEGFIRVEEAGTEDEQVGSFMVVSAEEFRASAPATRAGASADPAAVTGPAAAGTGSTGAPARPCRTEKAAYLSELWKASGIEVKDPQAVLEGLEAGSRGPATGFYWFALATDPFRPLAWSSELRSRADALARCVKEHGT